MPRRAVRALLMLVPLVALACGDDHEKVVVVADAGFPPLVNASLVHTNAPPSSLSLAGPTNATLAMALGPDGKWTALTARAPGEYVVPWHGDRWTAAFVCADEQNSYLDILDRPSTLGDFVFELAQPCALDPSDVEDVTGTFSHASPTTSWFDFGYLPDDRGSSLPVNGDHADYELVNIVSGKWDFIFGFRDDGFGPLTKILIVRDEVVSGPTVLNGDLATAVVPGSKALTITGLTPDEQMQAPIIYAVGGGTHGVDMGPTTIAGPNLVYATLPPEQQRPTDKYRLAFNAHLPDNSAMRGVNALFHDAVDITLDLAPPVPPPVIGNLGATPYQRLSMKTVGRANANTYELKAYSELSERRNLSWTYSTDLAVADGAEVAFEMPDFSGIPGWNPAWAVLSDRTKVTATVREKLSPLADGALERFASTTAPFTP